MILLSLVANIIIVSLMCKSYQFHKNEIIGAIVYENIGIIWGAIIFTLFAKHGLSTFRMLFEGVDLSNLGLSAYGGVIGAIVCLIIFSVQFKKPVKDMLFIFMPSIPLMYAIGKIGCFLVGCCHGIEYAGLGSVMYRYPAVAPANTYLFPVQLVETIVFTLIFIYMAVKSFKQKFNLKILGFSFVLCGFGKFALDFLRMSNIGQVLSLNQIVSIVFMVIGIVIVCKYREISPVRI